MKEKRNFQIDESLLTKDPITVRQYQFMSVKTIRVVRLVEMKILHQIAKGIIKGTVITFFAVVEETSLATGKRDARS